MLKPFTLRKKVGALLLIVIALYACLDFAIQRTVLMPAYSKLEYTEAAEDLARCMAALEGDCKYLDIMTHDWSSWDDTYRFVQDRNETYVEANLADSMFKINKLDMLCFADAKGVPFWCKFVPPGEETPVKLIVEPGHKDPLTLPLLLPKALTEVVSGIALTELGPMVVASRPVLRTSDDGSPQGICLMGHFLDDGRVQEFVEQTRVSFCVWPLDGSDLPKEERILLRQVEANGNGQVREVSPSELHGYGTYPGIQGAPALLVRATSSRDTMQYFLISARYARVLGIGAAITVLLFMFVLMERVVVRPIARVTRLAAEISESGNLGGRLPAKRRDEVGRLSEEFNLMIARLEEDTLHQRETEMALCRARDDLEERVHERTAQLANANEELKEEIHKREEAQQWLNLQATALDTTATGVVITDGSRHILWVNPAFCAWSGYSLDEVMGAHLCPLMLKEAEYGDMVGVVSRGLVWKREVRRCRKDGSIYTAVVTVTAWGESEGTPTHFVAIEQDVSEQRRLEEELRQSQKMEAVGRLAGGIAHDFNNLLTVITGYSELIMRSGALDTDTREGVEEIVHASDRATVLTRQLLAFSRRQVLMPRVLDLNVTVREVEKLLRRVIGEDIQLVTSLESRTGHVKVDPSQIEQVLMNLAINARDAMPEGGVLTIETASATLDAEQARQFVDLCPGPYVVLTVSDTGAGMDMETRARIFEPFFTTKPLGKGTGLGLSMVYGIVKQSGGHITVCSELGKGATFKILLPTTTEEPEGDATKIDVRLSGRGETILLVEDEEDVRKLTRRVLETYGYNVLDAPSALKALEIIEENGTRIDLVLTDVVMLHMSGHELSDRLASLHPTLKVVFMSAHADEDIILRSVSRDGRGFIQKPFTTEALLGQLRKHLEKEA